ncbi:hypothetical protein ACTJ2N_001482 [Vibrio fluvialis]
MNNFFQLAATLIAMAVYLIFSLGFILSQYFVHDCNVITLSDIGSLLSGLSSAGLLVLAIKFRNDWRQPKLFEKKTQAFNVVLNCIDSRSIALRCAGGAIMFSDDYRQNLSLYEAYAKSQHQTFIDNIRSLGNVTRELSLIVTMPSKNELIDFIEDCKEVSQLLEYHISQIEDQFKALSASATTPADVWKIFINVENKQSERAMHKLIEFIKKLN